MSALANKIDYFEIDVSGVEITSGDAGWYYAEVEFPENTLPSGAVAFSATYAGNWDANVSYNVLYNSRVILRSPVSKTLGTNRKVRVFYFKW